MKYGLVKVICPGNVGRMLNLIPDILVGAPGPGILPLKGILIWLDLMPRPDVPAAILGPPIIPALVSVVFAMKCAWGPGSCKSSVSGGAGSALLFCAQADMWLGQWDCWQG